jgi:VanZ family protein
MKILIFWKPILWLAIISYLSLIPGNSFPKIPLFNFPEFDKIVHAGFYFLLCIFFIRPFSKTTLHHYFVSWGVSLIISGLIEILQATLTRTRHADYLDFLANAAGASLALIIYRLLILGKKAEKFI